MDVESDLKKRIEDGWKDAAAGEIPEPAIRGEWNLPDHRAIEDRRDERYLIEAREGFNKGLTTEAMGELVCLWLRSELMIRSEEDSLCWELTPLLLALAATDNIRLEFDNLMAAWSESFAKDEYGTGEGARYMLDRVKLIRPYLDHNQRRRFDQYYRLIVGGVVEVLPEREGTEPVELPSVWDESFEDLLPDYAPAAARQGIFSSLLKMAEEENKRRMVWIYLITNYKEIENEHCFPMDEELGQMVLLGETDAYLGELAYIAVNEGSAFLEEKVRKRVEMITGGIRNGEEEFMMVADYAPGFFDYIRVRLMLTIGESGKRRLLLGNF